MCDEPWLSLPLSIGGCDHLAGPGQRMTRMPTAAAAVSKAERASISVANPCAAASRPLVAVMASLTPVPLRPTLGHSSPWIHSSVSRTLDTLRTSPTRPSSTENGDVNWPRRADSIFGGHWWHQGRSSCLSERTAARIAPGGPALVRDPPDGFGLWALGSRGRCRGTGGSSRCRARCGKREQGR